MNRQKEPAAPPDQFVQTGRKVLLLLALILLLAIGFSLLIGRYPSVKMLTPSEIAADELATKLVMNLRFPRILIAVLLGMSLSAAGLVFQMIFGNPLVEPGFLGVSQGASFGAAFAIIFLSNTAWLVQSSAAIFAILGLVLSYFLAHRLRYGGWVLRLILAGIAISALFSSGVGLLKYMADPLTQLPEITFWLLGGLSGSTWAQFYSILPVVSVSLLILILLRWRLNLLTLSDAASFSMGASPKVERIVMLGAAVLATASVISVSGMVTWVGLIIPHIARRIFGADSRLTLPATLFLGGLFTLICDDLARILLAGEIPLGIITSLLGALFFIILLSLTGARSQR
jgi:iron complex transport system permease protein